MFVNVSNHPVLGWSDAQRDAAVALGHGAPTDAQGVVLDVDPEGDWNAVAAQADRIVASLVATGMTAAHVASEPSLTVALIDRLRRLGVPSYTATTSRVVVQTPQPDGSVVKTSVFRFVRWRAFGGPSDV